MENLELLNKVPFGIIKCTYEKYPKVVYFNKSFLNFVGEDENSEWVDFVKSSIFLMVPPNEKSYLSECLELASKGDDPVELMHNLIDKNGHSIGVEGWIYKEDAIDGQEYYVIMYILHKSTARSRRIVVEHTYFKALESAYNVIFEINLKRGTVDCIYGRDTSPIGSTYDITMTVDSAYDYWINNYILPEDRDMVADMFTRIINQHELDRSDRPLQMEFGLRLDDGTIIYYLGVAVLMEGGTVLFCCRDVTHVKYADKSKAKEGNSKEKVFIRTFGHFDMFVGDKAVRFSSKREKELMALIVDRNGGNISSNEAISVLWEDEVLSDRVRTSYRKLAMGLKNTLEQYGIQDVIINRNGVRCMDVNSVICDYYEMLKGNEKYKSLFHGTYMSEYSWAEETLALLCQLS